MLLSHFPVLAAKHTTDVTDAAFDECDRFFPGYAGILLTLAQHSEGQRRDGAGDASRLVEMVGKLAPSVDRMRKLKGDVSALGNGLRGLLRTVDGMQAEFDVLFCSMDRMLSTYSPAPVAESPPPPPPVISPAPAAPKVVVAKAAAVAPKPKAPAAAKRPLPRSEMGLNGMQSTLIDCPCIARVYQGVMRHLHPNRMTAIHGGFLHIRMYIAHVRTCALACHPMHTMHTMHGLA
jgi:hypothetical protein